MLDRLSDEALRSTQFTWNRPEAPEEEAKDDEEMDQMENRENKNSSEL